ncbi:MAG TPA: ankyrin repeat domain-containing protein [Candidatus Sericytochromatia bacterium]|jgi:ankyrin repeat protein
MKSVAIGIFLLTLTACIPSWRTNEHPLIAAAKSGDINRIKAGIEADNSLVNLKRDDGVPLIYFAAVNRHVDVVTYLLDRGVNVNDDDEPLLHIAVNTNNLEFVKLLIKRGAKVNLSTRNGKYLPIHGVCNSENPEIAKLLIAHGASVSPKSKEGLTPLHRCQSRAVAEVLIKNGANVNAKDVNGYTPLHWFATPRETIDRPTIEYLLSEGADLNARDNQGLTARELAQKSEQWELIKILDTRVQPNP